MMKIRGVLLGTVEEQRAGGDDEPIDPHAFHLMTMSGPNLAPVLLNFDAGQKVGRVTRLWIEDARLMFEAELDVPPIYRHVGAGFSATRKRGEQVIRDADLFAVGLTDKPWPRDQPPFTVIEEGKE